jgi:ribosomal-protein-serine acetyltransferase
MNPILLDLPMPIVTPRLLIRPPQVGDGIMLNQAVIESFETLHQFMDWAKVKPSLEDSEVVVRREAANWIYKKPEDGELMLLILHKDTHEMVGATGYHNINWSVPCLETGYWLRTTYERNGYMTEAINAITRYAFKQLAVTRIAITCDVDNIRSKKIPERLGYQLEAILKSNRISPMTYAVSDTLVYTLDNLHRLPDLNCSWQ